MSIDACPKGYHTATPYLIVNDGAAALAFYTKAFGAQELMRMSTPGGGIAHAEIKIGDSIVMLADETDDMKQGPQRSPRSLGASTVGLVLHIEGVDARFKRAIDAGAKELRPVKDQFYGDRSGTLQDPFGHVWTLSTHVEDVAPQELERRARELFGG